MVILTHSASVHLRLTLCHQCGWGAVTGRVPAGSCRSLVDNIVVGISFYQLGGLCTPTFLEEMDRVIGPEHLFKKSIILVSRRDSRGGGAAR